MYQRSRAPTGNGGMIDIVQSTVPQDKGIVKKTVKTPYYAIIDQLMHKDLLKTLLILISGDNRGLNFTRKIVPSFVRVLPL